ncbi:MAG: protein-L-isoaspartate(D-aspartate) O-methyltransferase [Chloroflexota bacterium]|nr:protein-L-isoaspartate(D-aspartate) O-methyltransferase [Chloroflexota bacterium]
MSEARGARSDAARAEMVARQLRGRGIADERVLAAMGELPREAFIADTRRDYAYADGALPIAAGQTISQPYVVARMTELLRPKPGDRILEVGTGSGYQAAVLAKLGANVVSYERQPELAASARENLARLGLGDKVDVRLGDGSVGDPRAGKFDGIIVTAAAPRVPESLLEQLKDGGRMVIPVGPRDHQELLLIQRNGDEWTQRSDGPVVFVPLVGEGGYRE